MAYPGRPDQRPYERFSDQFRTLADLVEQVILGKRHLIELALTVMIAEGHLLIDDFPGLGKTSLAQAIAKAVAGEFRRIQFTPDILPSDITGSMILNERRTDLEFRRGPIFGNVVLCDEVNRGSPKAQSALLEVMEELRVTADGVSYRVPDPFMVMATQNPVDSAGTYPLPESQLDRFMMCVRIGYPDPATEREILRQGSTGRAVETMRPVERVGSLKGMIETAKDVLVKDSIYEFIVRILGHTRAQNGRVLLGASPRAGIALVRAAKVRAASKGNHFVSIEDVEQIAVYVLAHRLVLDDGARYEERAAENVVKAAVRAAGASQ